MEKVLLLRDMRQLHRYIMLLSPLHLLLQFQVLLSIEQLYHQSFLIQSLHPSYECRFELYRVLYHEYRR